MDRSQHIRNHGKPSELEVGLYEIDSAVKYYFDNKIMPRVFTSTGEPMQVPVVYGAPERWKSVQKSNYWRDSSGKVQFPLIMYKRTGMAKETEMGNKVDPDNPIVEYVENKYSKINKYDKFSKTYGTDPVREFSKLVVPDFVTLTYTCMIWTDFVQEMNKITEAINYSADTYWGNPAEYTFKGKVDDFSNTTEVSVGDDRVIKSEFSLELKGYITSNNIQRAKALKSNTSFGPATVRVGSETVVNIDNIPWLTKQTNKL
tara:strand:- start:547 stop:1323 length:777 start_codon:yes stop_codon:yes gene_type:complete